MSPLRPGFAQLALVARGEARLAFARAPEIIWRALGILGWAAIAIFLGSVVGFAAVLLPPMGALGIVAAVGLVLLWVMPDLAAVPDRIVRHLLIASLVVNLCVPYYYAILIEGLPFISIRRIFTLPLIVLCAIAISGSGEVRRRIVDILRNDRLLSVCIFGFITMIFLSIFTSLSPSASFSQCAQVILEWYAPFLAILYVIRSESDVNLLIRVVAWCTLFVCLMGLIEFAVHFNIFLRILPKSMLAALSANSANFANLINAPTVLRNGLYRASSVFVVGLSFAEFNAMMAPFALLFLLHATTIRDRAFGCVLLLATLLGIFVSGSRGGYISVFCAFVALLAAWLVRTRRFKPLSMSPAVGLLVGGGALVAAVLIVSFWGRAHNIVLGGGMEQYSDEGRRIEWALGMPKILTNPITGHGFGMGGDIIGYYPPGASFPTVDSYVLTTLVETGVPSTVFFFGMLGLAIWRGLRRYVLDPSWYGALAGGLACALVAYITYRTVLTQRENHTLVYVFVGCMMMMDYYYAVSNKSGKKGGRLADREVGGQTIAPVRSPGKSRQAALHGE